MYKCNLIDETHVAIDKLNGDVCYIEGEFRNGEFCPRPEKLAQNDIDENQLLDYLKKHPLCTDVKLGRY